MAANDNFLTNDNGPTVGALIAQGQGTEAWNNITQIGDIGACSGQVSFVGDTRQQVYALAEGDTFLFDIGRHSYRCEKGKKAKRVHRTHGARFRWRQLGHEI